MSEIDTQNRVQSADGLAWRTIDDDVYVFKMDGSLHVLEGNVAQVLWSQIDDGGASRDGLLDSMVSTFSVANEEASEDLDEFLGALLGAGLLVE